MTERSLILVQIFAVLVAGVAAHRRRSLLPAALALGAMLGLTVASYAVRGHPRLAVAVFAAWPAPVAWLCLANDPQPHRERVGMRHLAGADSTSGGARAEVHPSLRWTRRGVAHARVGRDAARVLTLLPFALTPPLLALWGSVLAPWWPWPLRAPRLAVGALATAIAWRRAGRGFSPVERVGMLLAAGQTAGVLVDAWTPWERMREVSAACYVGAALVLAWSARRA